MIRGGVYIKASNWNASIPVVQDHIHLDLEVDDRGVPVLTWAVIARQFEIETIMAVNYNRKGSLLVSSLMSSGKPVTLRNYEYRVHLKHSDPVSTRQLANTLKAFNGQQVYLVDSDHPNENEDHLPYVMLAYCEVGPLETVQHDLTRYEVDVSLRQVLP